jgi:protein-L-isoaspartate O-methyltransferase
MHRRLAVLIVLFVSLAGCLEARSDAPPRTEAKRLVELLGVESGDAVAEIGAGNGELTAEIARILGARSRVFTTELKRELSGLRSGVEDAPNVTVVEALADSTNLPYDLS